ncbi:hypothetical protein GCK72_006458 [Caenorhabditis remanei]|uniref:Uncharacterized protein n=1 Tax=Caenorhabditis remanei TaxID=31234 RepID=A0A6A5HHF3_CAERE|nr:hypothetical protein GCK72_006458 [Caenorhabditis remanei]KAF1766501.1 hypothetical protein GCK72_006458 [Caenorhabditis remanei]
MYPSHSSSPSSSSSSPHPDDSDANSEVSAKRRGRWDDKVMLAGNGATEWAGTREMRTRQESSMLQLK